VHLTTGALLHTTCAILLFFLLSRCGLPRTAASLSAGLFVLNPGALESAASLSTLPLLLSTFFALAALLTFLKTQDDPRWRWRILLNLFLISSLLSFEGAVVIPLLICIFSVITAKAQRHESASVLSLPLALLLVWVVFWAPRITPIQAGTSFESAAQSLISGAANCLHGIRNPAMLALYAFVFGSFLWHSAGRRFALACFGLFVTAYLPFLVFQSLAGKFAYLASAAAMTFLAAAIFDLSRQYRKFAITMAVAFLLLFAAGSHKIGKEVHARDGHAQVLDFSGQSR